MQRHILFAAALSLTLAAGSALAAEPPAEPTLVTNYGGKAPVTFDHALHKELDCASCHHNAQEAVYRCGQCHGEESAGAVPGIKDAMHGKDTGACTACHFGASPQAKKLKCGECHVKR